MTNSMKVAVLTGSLIVWSAWCVNAGYQAGRMDALKTAYQVYKAQVPWRCD